MFSHDRINELYANFLTRLPLPKFKWQEATDSDNHHDIIYGIVCDGLRKKYEVPTHEANRRRQCECLESFLSCDSRLKKAGDFHPCFQFSRDFLQSFFSNYKLDFGDCWFGPGECYDSHRGNCSALSKLSKLPWTVTDLAADQAIEMLWDNRQIRRFIASNLPRSRSLSDFHKNRTIWFRENLLRVPGSRFSTVPKNNEKDRDICVEPKLNMMLQKGLGAFIRKRLRLSLNIDLDTLQELHGVRIGTEEVSTIDFSSASNSINLDLIHSVVPENVYRDIYNFRSAFVRLPCGTLWKLRKVSSMGNGFTFELMTVLLLSFARYFDDTATVFGDDVIIKDSVAKEFVEFMDNHTDFTVNKQKTCIKSRVKESCGYYTVDKQYVLRYDVKYVNNLQDAVVLHNKLFNLSMRYSDIRLDHLNHTLRLIANELGKYVGSGPPGPNLDTYLFTNDFIPFSPNKRLLQRIAKDFCYRKDEISLIQALAFKVVEGKDKRTINSCKSTDPRALTVFLRSGRRPTLQKRGSGRITSQLLLIHKLYGPIGWYNAKYRDPLTGRPIEAFDKV